jgi:alpha-acetolactate decarboxylase
MRKMRVLSLGLVLFWSTLACVHAQENDVLTQVSTIDALLSGIYDSTADFLMILPQDAAFSAADFSTDKQNDLSKVEK